MKTYFDIPYKQVEGHDLYADFYVPEDVENPPVIMWIHGGGWTELNRKWCLVYPQLKRGYAVCSVDYRYADEAVFPAQMLDTKAAVRFMKINAHKYGLNPDKMYLMGDSSGGHTVLMAGLTVGIERFEEELYSEVSSSVKGIIDLFGPTDITKMNDELSAMDHMAPDSPEGCLIGGRNVSEHPELTAPTVVMNYVDATREIPPVLIFHGTNDELVPFGQSCMLYDKLVQCNKKAEFYAIDNAHHGGREFWSNQVLDIIEKFINRV